MEKLDLQKKWYELCMAEQTPSEIVVPAMSYLMVDGSGAPEGEEYQTAMQVLYGLTETIKRSGESGCELKGYVDFAVPPPEGLWTLGKNGFDPDRDQWHWTSMLWQPEFVTQDVFEWACETAAQKNPAVPYSRARLETYEEGLCVQLMHVGPYTTEQASIDKISNYILEHSLEDRSYSDLHHHEIYLSNPQSTAPEQLKTVLRHPVKRI